MRRTNDAVGHTSVHHHNEGVETYYALRGAAVAELRDIHTGSRNTVRLVIGGGLSLTVPVHVQHPIVMTYQVPSVMLIASNPPNNSKNDHHYDGLFRNVFSDVIASHIQRTRDLSATAPEAGNP